MSSRPKISVPLEDIFNSALCSHITMNYLARINPTKTPDLAIATVTTNLALSAFTLELFLKCLHVMDHGDIPPKHDLHLLFSLLKKKSRIQIENGWNEIVKKRQLVWEHFAKEDGTGSYSTDLREALLAGRNAFERYRYFFEPENMQGRYYIDDLRHVLYQVIITRRPEFADAKPTIRTQPTSPVL